MKEKFSVYGMTCTACSAGIERTVQKLNGVESVEVSLLGESMSVSYDETKLSSAEIIASVEGLGYAVKPYNIDGAKAQKPYTATLKNRFWISLCILVPLMYCSMGGMIGVPVPPNSYNYIIQAVLSLVVIIINFRFFTSGAKSLVKGVPNMDTLVSLGSAVSWGYSAVLTIIHFINDSTPHMYFESAAMILTLVTLGKWLEEKSKKKTGDEVEKLIGLMPSTVVIEEGESQRTIPFSEIAVGDVLIVRQGDYIPIDGKIVEGHAFIDRSAITGESLPVEAHEGDAVSGADIVKSGYIKVLAEKVGADTTLSQIVKMVKEAGASKAPLQKTADKIAGIFVPLVCMIALCTLLVWVATTGNIGDAANYAISVLVISCPCSLGLATPVAVMAATGRGMSLGILYKDAETLQRAKDINCVLLDKTATLTEGLPKVVDFECFTDDEGLILSLAYAIEKCSNHPLAECIKSYAQGRADETVSVDNYRYEMGKGAVAEYGGETYYLGNRKLLGKAEEKKCYALEHEYSKQGKTTIFLAKQGKLMAVFAVADTLKTSSREGVALLKARSIKTAILTGDVENVAAAIAKKVDIDEFFAEAMPADKAQAVQRIQSVGGIVAMVGDGVNDSPALKAADVGVAMGKGTDIAIDSADVVLVNGDIRTVATMVDLSKFAVRNIVQNLFWAFFYNVVAIPVAAGAFAWAGVHLNPMIAAACMSLSSLFVVGNALRLTRFGKKKTDEKPLQQPTEEEEKSMKVEIKIEGMMCKHCVAHVEKALTALPCVASVEVDLGAGTATVVLASDADDAIFTAAIVDAGYEVVEIKRTK